MPEALVVGAGVSGLAAARALARAGVEVAVVEAAEAPGGTFATAARGGFLAELGPNTVQESPELRALAEDAGAIDELVAAAPAAGRRYVVHRGRPVPLPGSPPALLASPLLSAAAKVRLATEPWRPAPRAPDSPSPDESFAAFLRRRLGAGVLPLGDAMALGIYAGDPEELAVGYAFPTLHALERRHGSLLRGLRRSRRVSGPAGKPAGEASAEPAGPRRLIAFRGGAAAFAGRLAAGLELATGCRAESVRRDGDLFRVSIAARDGRREIAARRLIVALPAAAAAAFLAPLGAAAAALDGLPQAPVAVVALGFARGDVTHPLDGFGLLAPHREGRDVLGVLFPSTLFPGRAPAGAVLLTAMVGGRRRPELVELPDGELIARVRGELAALLGARGEPIFTALGRWRPGIPQPTARAAAVRAAAAALERSHPGLAVLGNWRYGVGVPDCVRAGWSLGEATP
jgi:oxygen-dependent protoporphyrinogen oxidase